MSLDEGRGRTVVGLVLIGLGALFLAQQFLDFDFWTYSWPFFIIVPGVLMLAVAVVAGSSLAALAVPGSIVAMVGLILLYQNAFDHFQSWAYAWTLIFPTAIGAGLWIQGWRTAEPRLRSTGRGMIGVGLLMFVVAAAFFELVINISGWADGISDVIFPVLLILVGVVLLVTRGLRLAGRARL